MARNRSVYDADCPKDSTFADIFSKLRSRHGSLSFDKLQDLTGNICGSESIRIWELGRSLPTNTRHVRALSKAMGCNEMETDCMLEAYFCAKLVTFGEECTDDMRKKWRGKYS